MRRLAGTTIAIAALAAVAVAPADADAAAYTKYVGCKLGKNVPRAHVCRRDTRSATFVGAYFISHRRDVYYTICVTFPGGATRCARHQPAGPGKNGPARRGDIYANKITSFALGPHKVTWFVDGRRVGRWFFRIAR
jgi:hypothetical protein